MTGCTSVDKLTIRWPDGESQVIPDIAADRFLRIEQGKDPGR